MGFKKTSEGRVFFEGANDRANDGFFQEPRQDSRDQAYRAHLSGQNPSPASSPPTAPLGSMQEQKTQMQIVTLLKTLNERLKVTQAERNAMRKELDVYRDIIGDLEHKAERSEKAYLTLEQKVSTTTGKSSGEALALAGEALKEMEDTRRLLLSLEGKTERADSDIQVLKHNIERHQVVGNQLLQKSEDQTALTSAIVQRLKKGEERAEGFSDKLEQTTSEQSRIGRKLDKALEERARFMRKIERIEETVIQTRDSLNAKAMVLLTDQQMAPPQEALLQDTQAARPAEAALLQNASSQVPQRQKENALWAWLVRSQRYIYGFAAALVVFLFAGWLVATSPSFDWFQKESQTDTLERVETLSLAPRISPAPPAVPEIINLEEVINRNIQVASELPAESALLPEKIEPQFEDDIGALDLNDPAQVEAALEGKTEDVIAKVLNKIEPGETAQVVPIAQAISALKVEDKVQSPVGLIKPDSALGDVIQKIEGQAFQGVAAAQHDLAAIYTAGHGGVQQDYKRARFWFEQAAARGLPNAAYNLGVFYHQGLGVQASIDQALDWYKRAAERGHPEAQYNLGIAYIEGLNVPYDPAKATQYFTKAADQDIMEAAYNLGLIYENGLLGNAKPDEALMWYKIAADQGSPEARQALEQLAKILEIDPAKVNQLAEGMKKLRAPDTVDAIAERSANTVPNPALNAQILVAQIQDYLIETGLYPGPADGVNGPLTQDAVRSYQRRNNLDVDGLVSPSLLDHMARTL